MSDGICIFPLVPNINSTRIEMNMTYN
jgi:hypothetical protein